MKTEVKTESRAHTAGPWRPDVDSLFIFGPNTEMIAEMRGAGANLPIEANAKLIAAAPEMAEALKALLKAYNQLMPGLKNIAVEDYANINDAPRLARAALAKAGQL